MHWVAYGLTKPLRHPKFFLYKFDLNLVLMLKTWSQASNCSLFASLAAGLCAWLRPSGRLSFCDHGIGSLSKSAPSSHWDPTIG